MIENFTKVVCVIRPIRLDCAPRGGVGGGFLTKAISEILLGI